MGAHSLPVVLGRRTSAPRLSACANNGVISMLLGGQTPHGLLVSALQWVRDMCTVCAWCLHYLDMYVAGDITGAVHVIKYCSTGLDVPV